MMYDDLIKRLRCLEYGSCPDCPMWYSEEVEPNLWRERCAAIDAADAIEELANRMRWTLCKDKQPPNGNYIVYKRVYGSAYLYDVGTYAEDLSKIDEYDFPKEQYKGVGGWFDYDSEMGYYQTNVFAWMPLLPEPPKEGT